VPTFRFVEKLRVECLSCGARRIVVGGHTDHVDAGECHRCGYVGWASSDDLTQSARRQLRDRPVERRRLRILFS
jgi:Zn ribbon nucleic-acid-binding protein